MIVVYMTRGFNKHQRPRKRVGFFALSSRPLFSPKKKQIGFKNVMNKRYIIKSELKLKLIMMSFQGPLICYAIVTPEVLLVTQLTLYFSQFFPRFFVGLCRICLCANVLNLNIDICSLLVRIDCVAMKPEWKLYFLEWKTRSSVPNWVSGTLEIAF